MITMTEFIEKHGDTASILPIQKIIEKWEIENEVDRFLKTQIGSNGVLIADIFLNPDIQHDGISKDLLHGFSALMKAKANTYEDVHKYLIKSFQDGPKSFHGLFNKIQGQIGENQFAHYVGSHAQTAKSGSQEAWDFVVHHSHGDQYVQVKVYQESAKAIAAIKEVNAKVAAGLIKSYDGSHIVKRIDFAVNDDIYEHVKREVARQKLHITFQKIGATHDQIQRSLVHADYRITSGLLHNYFYDLFRGALVGSTLIAVINAFLVWKGSKEREVALEDTLYGSVTATGGVASVLTFKALIGGFLGPIGFITSMGIGMGTRSVIGRFFNRRHMVERLLEGNSKMRLLCLK